MLIVSSPHVKLKIHHIDETYQGQIEKHGPVACEGDDNAHNHWPQGHSQILERLVGPDSGTT
jgi:hypothetical protein